MMGGFQREMRDIRSSPNFRIGNVVDYALKFEKIWDYEEDIPNWSPPFGKFWMEWNHPSSVGKLVQFGLFFNSAILDDSERERLSKKYKVTDEESKFPWGPVGGAQERFMAALSSAKWVLNCSCWTAGVLDIGGAGSPSRLNYQALMLVGDKGRLLVYSTSGDPEIKAFMEGLLVFGGLGISFMHCKNVKQVEAKEDPGERFRKQYKVPKFTYRTLCIDPMKEVLRREGQSDTTGLKRALHICRGHFSTYSDEKPLFGKYAGTFWVPDHVRGKKEHGEVVKDYEVKSPAE